MAGLKEEKKLWNKGYKVVVGIDEAGRGPLFGPVVAGAVAINKNIQFKSKNLLKQVKDSKKLSAKKREEIFKLLKKHPQIEWAIGRAGHKVIDRINILQASKLAMKRAVDNLMPKIKGAKSKNIFLLVDGNFDIPIKDVAQESIIRGDEKIFSIQLASIIAKVSRDKIMLKYHKKYPKYGFDKHKGYPTREHLAMLRKYGACEIHRKSFGPVKNDKSQ